MRYRIFANGFLHYFGDRQSSFDESLIGKDPNNPVGGEALNVLDQDYVVTDYREYAGKEENSTENESHEIAQDWFADVEEVKAVP